MDDNLMLIKQFQMQGGTKGADAAFAALEKPYPITEWYLKLFTEAAKG